MAKINIGNIRGGRDVIIGNGFNQNIAIGSIRQDENADGTKRKSESQIVNGEKNTTDPTIPQNSNTTTPMQAETKRDVQTVVEADEGGKAKITLSTGATKEAGSATKTDEETTGETTKEPVVETITTTEAEATSELQEPEATPAAEAEATPEAQEPESAIDSQIRLNEQNTEIQGTQTPLIQSRTRRYINSIGTWFSNQYNRVRNRFRRATPETQVNTFPGNENVQNTANTPTEQSPTANVEDNTQRENELVSTQTPTTFWGKFRNRLTRTRTWFGNIWGKIIRRNRN